MESKGEIKEYYAFFSKYKVAYSGVTNTFTRNLYLLKLIFANYMQMKLFLEHF